MKKLNIFLVKNLQDVGAKSFDFLKFLSKKYFEYNLTLRRNCYKILFIFLTLFLSFSCTPNLTKKMWSPFYQERIGNFMVSQNAQHVVFLGDKYHYILNDNTGFLKKLLFSQYRYLMSLVPSETKINLSTENDIQADIVIKLNLGNLVMAERELANAGFTKNRRGEYYLRFTLFGKRYFANKNLHGFASPMNRQYDIAIYTELSDGQKIKNAALTPITATIDATLLIGKIILMPLAGN